MGASADAAAPGARPGAAGSGRVPRRLPSAGGPFGLPVQQAERSSPRIFEWEGWDSPGVCIERQGDGADLIIAM